ncbi:7537_t:CDS:2 [Entrophospora sp. SA101]|nr:7537_t:CDS:2 [Entrophospora sp. SA101]
MSTSIHKTSTIVDNVKHYFNSDSSWQVDLEELVKLLETKNIKVTARNLNKILQNSTNEFELSKTVNNGVIVKLKNNITTNPFITTTNTINNNGVIVKLKNGISGNGNQLIKEFQKQQGQLKLNKKDAISVTSAINYLKKHLADSTFELEKYLNSIGVLVAKNFDNFLLENEDVFHVYKNRGINCVQLKNSTKIIDENTKTMIDLRMEQTENDIKEYIQQNSSTSAIMSAELVIYLRDIKGSITHDLKEFIKNCPDSFEWYEKDGFFVKNKPKISTQPINPTIYHSPYRSTINFFFKLIRDFLVKEYIATYSELDEYLKKYPQLPKTNLRGFLSENRKEFNVALISGETYITLNPTEKNILCHARRFLVEYGRVQFSLVGDYLKRLDFSPKMRLKELLSIYSDFKFEFEASVVFVKSHDAEIIRTIREMFGNDKKELELKHILNNLSKKNLLPNNGRLINFLEPYTEFDFYRSPVDIVVVHKPDKSIPDLKSFINKMIIYGNGQATYSRLSAVLNWKGDYDNPDNRLLDLINQSDEFQQSSIKGKYSSEAIIIFKSADNPIQIYSIDNIHNNKPKVLLPGEEETIDFISSTVKPNGICSSIASTTSSSSSSSITTNLNTKYNDKPSIDQRRKTITTLWENGTCDTYTLHKLTSIPLSTIYDYIKKLRNGIFLDPKQHSGRPRKLSPKQRCHLGQLVSKNKFSASAELANILNKHHSNLNISNT